jgi:prepilin-type processing-associated H-X9-DG protein
MRCVEVPGAVTLTRFAPCSSGGVGPAPSVSFGFNYRLHTSIKGEVMLTAAVLEGYGQVAPGNLPLLMDVDGRLAEQSDKSPVFTAPRMSDSTGLFDQVWFPGKRHKGSVNVAFIDGHVAASKTPDAEPGWAWEFTPPR